MVKNDTLFALQGRGLSAKTIKKLKHLSEDHVARLLEKTPEELRTTVGECEAYMGEKKREMEANDQYSAAKEIVKMFRSGLTDALREHKTIKLAALELIELSGKTGGL